MRIIFIVFVMVAAPYIAGHAFKKAMDSQLAHHEEYVQIGD